MGLFKKPGSSLTGVITGYKFDTKEFEGKETYYRASAAVEFRGDGADEDTVRFLDAGFWYPDDRSLSDDGRTIEGGDDQPIKEDTEFAGFIGSLIEKGFPESAFDPSGRNYEPMIGTRIELVQVIDEERQMAAGRKKLGAKANTASKEEIMAAGKRVDRKDKTKSYNQTQQRVGAVLALPEAKKAGKAAAKTATKTAGKGNGKAPEVDTDHADTVITEILAAAQAQAEAGKRKSAAVQRTELSMLVVRYAADKTNNVSGEDRETLRKVLSSEDYLTAAAERGVLTYDPSDKRQPVGLAA